MANNVIQVDLTDLERDGDVSLTRQLVDRFTDAIDSGHLEPGEKLPTTRALAAEAGINHLTAARVYRRLAEQGYVTATVGRGTFVRSLTPAAVEDVGDDWQTYALPDRPVSYSEQILADAFRFPFDPGLISLSTGWPSPRFPPVRRAGGDHGRGLRRLRTSARSSTSPPRVSSSCASRSRRVAGSTGVATDPDEIIVTTGAQQAIDLVARALLEPGDVVVVESPTFTGACSPPCAAGRPRDRRPVDDDGLDVDALEQVLARHEVQAVRAPDRVPEPDRRRPLPRARERAWPELAVERNFFVIEDAVYADLRYEGERRPALRATRRGT